jgi:dinuclear metal center YbgI/SA1388 family protein
MKNMELKIKDILKVLQEKAPIALQESYDNSGLLIGDKELPVKKALVCIDLNEAVLEEAIQNNCTLIISHHPLIFKSLKKIVPENLQSRIIIRAIQQQIAVVAMHTNLDNSHLGVNKMIGRKLGLQQTSILQPISGILRKIVTFCPVTHSKSVMEAMASAGAGHIGNYDQCSFGVSGTGTFRANASANPYVGRSGELHEETETRIEMAVPEYSVHAVVNAMKSVHPYEEVAYDIYPLTNEMPHAGAGLIGSLSEEMTEAEFLAFVQSVFETPCLKHTVLSGRKIRKIAVCGGSGAFLIAAAVSSGADAFITADVKYHDFFDSDSRMLLIDAGHFETEQFTKELIIEMIQEKFPTFALLNSEINTNPVYYYQ